MTKKTKTPRPPKDPKTPKASKAPRKGASRDPAAAGAGPEGPAPEEAPEEAPEPRRERSDAELAQDIADLPAAEAEADPAERRAQRAAAREAERSSVQSRIALRQKVRMFYDLQRLRIQSGGRGTPKAEGGEVQLHEADVVVLDSRSSDLLRAEKAALTDIKDHLASLPYYRDVLSDKTKWKGLGPTLAGVILSEIDPRREETASQLWSYAGLRPVPVMRCGRCHVPLKEGESVHAYQKTACDQVTNPYASGKAMRPVAGEKRAYNAFLKTKLIGVLGPCLLKANSPWRSFYDDYKHRKTSAGWGMSDAHRHNAAIRYMVKMLLLEFWKTWRTYEGLPIRESYHDQYIEPHHPKVARRA